MELTLSIITGIGLAAACGFRVFVPFLVISVASLAGHLELSPGFSWIGTYPALAAFAAATFFEVTAYYSPWLDNLLDAIAGPAAVIAGTLMMASFVTDMDPMLKWTLAIIAGGGAAGIVQGATTLTRAVSTIKTAGTANFLVSTAEAGLSAGLSVMAVLVPVIALAAALLAVLLLALAAKRSSRKKTS